MLQYLLRRRKGKPSESEAGRIRLGQCSRMFPDAGSPNDGPSDDASVCALAGETG